MQRADDK